MKSKNRILIKIDVGTLDVFRKRRLHPQPGIGYMHDNFSCTHGVHVGSLRDEEFGVSSHDNKVSGMSLFVNTFSINFNGGQD